VDHKHCHHLSSFVPCVLIPVMSGSRNAAFREASDWDSVRIVGYSYKGPETAFEDMTATLPPMRLERSRKRQAEPVAFSVVGG
jgi:hypothetical protein